MARSYVGNPNRNTGSGMTVRCRRLAELNNQSAAAHCDQIVALSRDAAKETTAAAEMYTQFGNIGRYVVRSPGRQTPARTNSECSTVTDMSSDAAGEKSARPERFRVMRVDSCDTHRFIVSPVSVALGTKAALYECRKDKAS